MTPYVINEESTEGRAAAPQKPKSIMVGPTHGLNGAVNGGMNGGTAVHLPATKEEDAAESPDSLPSRSSVSGRSIIGNGKNGRTGALKRVSFGSSKGSMVETLVYDHLDDLPPDLPPYFTTPPVTNGEESREHPSKVRVKFIENQQVSHLACAPPSPDVTLLDLDTMTLPADHPDYQRQISHESGIDNPFRPDGELSREADTIVSLIKEGKPITPLAGEDTVDMENGALLHNGVKHDQPDAMPEVKATVKGANGNALKAVPGVVEVQHGIVVPPCDAPAVEQVVIKKKPKCNCCVIA